MQDAGPFRLADLRLALGCLYSLPHVDVASDNRPTPKQSHDYLMEFQMRNIRRKLTSQVKSGIATDQHQQVCALDRDDMGSSWLTCIAILSAFMCGSDSSQVHYAEALFAAQTLVHRIRRIKIDEAIDIEMEQQECHPLQFPVDQITPLYRRWAQSFHPVLKYAVDQYQPRQADECSIKGEISMIMLGTILHCTITFYKGLDSTIRPLVSTLGSALAALAARLRYTPKSMPNPDTEHPIVVMVLQVLELAEKVVTAGNTQSLNSHEMQLVSMQAKHACLAAIPDALLTGSGSSNGAQGRLSIDPRCYQAINTELRVQGIGHVSHALSATLEAESYNAGLFILSMTTFEQWAKYAPIPFEVVRHYGPIIDRALQKRHTQEENEAAKASMSFLTAVFEGGTWTTEQVLESSVIQHQESSSQANKKRQSSRSKKRKEAVIKERTTDTLLSMAQTEAFHRGDCACELLTMVWASLHAMFLDELNAVAADDDTESFGDGPIGCLTAAGNAVLPTLLRRMTTTTFTPDSLAVFDAVATAIASICSCQNRTVRAFGTETIYALHEAVVKSFADGTALHPDFRQSMCSHFFRWSMNLSISCAYPPSYFNDLAANNDDSIEVERNEVRDTLRAITTLPTNQSGDGAKDRVEMAVSITAGLVSACATGISSDEDVNEAAMHAFSGLARSLNHLSRSRVDAVPLDQLRDIFRSSLNILMTASQRLLALLSSNAPFQDTLPPSRIFNLAVGSMAPMLSQLLMTAEFGSTASEVLVSVVKTAALSLSKIPELTGPSTLSSTRYDIRGAMRSPGGEDHVGCLALMRLVQESNALALFIANMEGGTFTRELCQLYNRLKTTENKRGCGVFYGIGIFPKSRRILLRVICDLEQVAAKNGAVIASPSVRDIFCESISSINSFKPSEATSSKVQLCALAEQLFDVAAFSPTILAAAFQFQQEGGISNPAVTSLEIIHQCVDLGFKSQLGQRQFSDEELVQWNRIRAALFTLLQEVQETDIPSVFSAPVVKLIKSECDAILQQCSQGPNSSSLLFHDELVSGDTIPAGLFVRALCEMVERAVKLKRPQSSISNTMLVLGEVKGDVLASILSACPDPIAKGSFEDPRPYQCEAWLTLACKVCDGVSQLGWSSATAVVQSLLVETCVTCLCLLLYPSLGKTQAQRLHDPGMSMDGPHTLALMEFLQGFFLLGGPMLEQAAMMLLEKVLIDPTSTEAWSQDPRHCGLAIIGSALFRAAQGGLPPWAVESIPSVYSALFHALQKDVAVFGTAIEMSMHVRMKAATGRGKLLAGRYFEKMSDKAKKDFVTQTVSIANQNTTSSWKRLKAVIKSACGGKKSGTDFNQRPSYTVWLFDRV